MQERETLEPSIATKKKLEEGFIHEKVCGGQKLWIPT